MATKNSKRQTYESTSGGYTSIDLSRVCAYTYTIVESDLRVVEFHMDSGTIFSVRMNNSQRNELGKIWAYWRDE
tara:strand:- start:24 stop:245 length:222 start_codon:yes stop_codon:yes gene_type:complete